MKIHLRTICTFLFIQFCFQSLASAENVDLVAQNHRVLSGRVYKILQFRFQGLANCSSNQRNTLEKEFSTLPRYSHDRQTVVKTLDLYHRSYSETDSNCKNALDLAEQNFHRAERKKFTPITGVLNQFCKKSANETSVQTARDCHFKLHQVFSDLDPHCVSLQVPNASGIYDPFPCLAADYLVGKSLVNEKTWKSFLFLSQGFLENLRIALAKPDAPQTGIDLWQIYLQDNPDRPELREQFLAEIDFYFSSFHSASSYIRGFHDHIWSFLLFKTGSAEKTVDYFVSSRLIVDHFRTLQTWASKKRIAFNLNGISMKEKNRHDYMAAYLACHYREEKALIHTALPYLLGVAYEGLDFKSHLIDDGDSWKVAKENFVTDTRRYKTGAGWGYKFCKMQD